MSAPLSVVLWKPVASSFEKIALIWLGSLWSAANALERPSVNSVNRAAVFGVISCLSIEGMNLRPTAPLLPEQISILFPIHLLHSAELLNERCRHAIETTGFPCAFCDRRRGSSEHRAGSAGRVDFDRGGSS